MRVDAFQQQAQVLVFVLCEMVGTHGGFSRYGNNWFVVGSERRDCNDADERELHRALFCVMSEKSTPIRNPNTTPRC